MKQYLFLLCISLTVSIARGHTYYPEKTPPQPLTLLKTAAAQAEQTLQTYQSSSIPLEELRSELHFYCSARESVINRHLLCIDETLNKFTSDIKSNIEAQQELLQKFIACIEEKLPLNEEENGLLMDKDKAHIWAQLLKSFRKHYEKSSQLKLALKEHWEKTIPELAHEPFVFKLKSGLNKLLAELEGANQQLFETYYFYKKGMHHWDQEEELYYEPNWSQPIKLIGGILTVFGLSLATYWAYHNYRHNRIATTGLMMKQIGDQILSSTQPTAENTDENPRRIRKNSLKTFSSPSSLEINGQNLINGLPPYIKELNLGE